MRRFIDKRATVVDVTDKEVIDLFQDGLYHRRTFKDFGRPRPSSIIKLKDMITSWVDKEDKANDKYDSIRGKSNHNRGGNKNNNNRDQGGRNNNNYSGPNRKRKLDNTVVAIQHPAKDNSKKTSGGLKDLLKEKCLWHLEGNTPPSSATNSGEDSKTHQIHDILTTRRARRKPTRAMVTSKNPTRW
jgi:hypothetical protein